MQSTLTGPTGAAMIRPTAKPRMGNTKSIIMALDSGMDEPSRAAQLRIRTVLQNACFNRPSLQTGLRLHYAHEWAPVVSVGHFFALREWDIIRMSGLAASGVSLTKIIMSMLIFVLTLGSCWIIL